MNRFGWGRMPCAVRQATMNAVADGSLHLGGRTEALIRLPAARDAFVDQLAPGESFLRTVPVGN